MKKKLLYIAMLLFTALGFQSCDEDKALPPMVYPEEMGDGSGAAPFNVGTALVKIYSNDYTSKKVFIKGIVSRIDSYNASYGNITYYISDDGTTTNELEVYRGLGMDGDKFASGDALKVGDEVVIYGEMTYYNSSTAEITQGSMIVDLNGVSNSDYKNVVATPAAGDGSGADPYNVAAATDVIASGDIPAGDVYIKGKISKIDNIDTSFGNATYYISDSGSIFDQLEVYRGYSLNGNKFTSTSEIKVGDDVIVLGKLVNFNGTYEVTQGSRIVSLNGSPYDPGQSGPGADPTGDGTQASPYNIARALEIINSGTYTEDKVYISGTISKVDEVDPSYGNATYNVSDNGSDNSSLKVFRGYYLGGEKFTSADQIKVGDKVVVYGALTNFMGNTPEVTQGNYIVTLNGSGSAGGDNPPAGSAIYSGLKPDDANALDGWTIDNVTLPEGGTYVWSWKEYNSKYYLNASGYIAGASQNAEAYAWTTIDLAGYKTASMTFEHAAKFQTTLTQLCGVVVRESGTTAWTTLTVPTWPAAGSWTFQSAGNINLDAYAGKKVDLGFIYKSNTTGADTWEIKNLAVTGSK